MQHTYLIQKDFQTHTLKGVPCILWNSKDELIHFLTDLESCVVITKDEVLVSLAFENGANHVLCLDPSENINEVINEYFALQAPLSPELEEFTTSCELKGNLQEATRLMAKGLSPLLLLGETGVGKSYLARNLHQHLFPGEPFVEKNLLELNETVFESELFGHIKGSFTGATADKEGLLSKANGGTLFLDEIGLLPLSLQQKLLKVIEEKTFTPVGSCTPKKVEFKLITATCENLKKLLKENKLREDFYHRISSYELTIPPLRDRPEDLKIFLAQQLKETPKRIYLTEDAHGLLMKYSWPGNLREIKSFAQKLIISQKSIFKKADITEIMGETSSTKKTFQNKRLPELVEELELKVFKIELEKVGEKPNRICESLGISKSVYYRLLKTMKREANDLPLLPNLDRQIAL